ncbi:helix-turn-helix transcriptional regulator [Streptomyces diastatochromogenes]|uniref:Helix-turn-helix transcriptional regulator n=1 Tax=Streptomyces diastatochromogenes TaxID=42236 RepID=A0A233SPR4_STRDA|nr:helix-turn-helix transcriptional regulator [Streptomyces diastatochromogenes]OXY97625.1 helix-turn-helix transcriptional regulator [Streptomyces diastatochromogenes]
MTARAHDHGPEELCEAGLQLYTRALREGQVPAGDADALPCLLDTGLLQPDVADARRLRPVAPSVALTRLLRVVDEDIAHRRRQGARLTEALEPLLALAAPDPAPADAAGIRMLSGLDRINVAISEAMEQVSGEILAIQPHARGNLAAQATSLARDQALLDRGGRIRTLYQHTQRHVPLVVGRYEMLRGDVEARTLDEVTERLLIIDRRVAFIPANKDRTLALEIRHPALLDHFAIIFDRLWHLATPMHPEAAQRPTLNGVTPRQRAIAGLLIEGHTDAVIADRLGMNVRTARVHIAKLAATLGSESRAQLGYLIGQSGILDPEEEHE